MIRKLIGTALLLVGALAVVGPAAPALAGGGASDYADCVLTVDPSTFEAGATVTVTGDGFQPSFETTLEFHSVAVVVGTVTTDANGAFTTSVTIPTDAVSGPHTITAPCDADLHVVTTTVTVSSSGIATTTTTGGGPLPRTGSDPEPYVLVGAAALVVGVAFVLVAKRRRRSVA